MDPPRLRLCRDCLRKDATWAKTACVFGALGEQDARIANVAVERRLARNALGFALGSDRAVVVALREIACARRASPQAG
jgi:hypothetical protein